MTVEMYGRQQNIDEFYDCRRKHRNVWFCCIIALIPVIQSLRFPARCNIKTPLHWQCLMQKQRFAFQIFSFTPTSVHCSWNYHNHISIPNPIHITNSVAASHLSDHILMWWRWDYFLLKCIVSHKPGTLAWASGNNLIFILWAHRM